MSLVPPSTRLLYADDDPGLRELLEVQLGQMGLSVTLAPSGRVALERLDSEEDFSLVLLDIEMPVMSGLQVLETIRSRWSRSELPVIMLTGRAESEDIVRALRNGANDYLTKPVDLDVAFARIQTQLELRRAQQSLRESEERFSLAIRGANDAIWDYDVVERQLYLSPRWGDMLGRAAEHLRTDTETWLESIHENDRERMRLALDPTSREAARAAWAGREEVRLEFRAQHADGRNRWLMARGSILTDAEGVPYRAAGSISDVTASKLRHGISGLPNETLLLDSVERCLSAEESDRTPSALVRVRLDRFSTIRSGLDVEASESLLRQVARRLAREISRLHRARGNDSPLVAHLDDDEFAVFIETLGSPDRLTQTIADVQSVLVRPFIAEERPLVLTACLGAVQIEGYEEASRVLQDAAIALERARAEGAGSYAVFDLEMHSRIKKDLDFEAEMRAALAEDAFELHFQPIVDLTDQRVVGLEGLLRWTSSSRGNVSAAEFIPLAEETGLIVELGEATLRMACAERAVLEKHGRSDVFVAVNVSSRQFADPNLGQLIDSAIEESGIDPSGLKIEITETFAMRDTELTMETLLHLRQRGLTVAIDDFGTGYSSLAYLEQFPCDTLKIDRAFISRLAEGSEADSIVRAILAMATSLERDVVAEGIETQEQLRALVEMGCELGQGFLFSRAVPAEELAEQLFGQSVEDP